MHRPQVFQGPNWKRFLRGCLTEVWLPLMLSLFGCFHNSQMADDGEVASSSKMRPIDIDATTAEGIGRDALRKFGYEEIITLAEKARFIEYKSNVRIQLASYEPAIATGFVPVFSRYALAAGVTSQADSPLPGPADIAAVGVIVIGLVDAGLLDGYLLDTLGGWLFSKAQTDLPAGTARVTARAQASRWGNCTEDQHNTLQGDVEKYCRGSFSCKGDQDCSTLRNNLSTAQSCAQSRENIDKTCFGGGNRGHQQAASDARRAAEKCQYWCGEKKCA